MLKLAPTGEQALMLAATMRACNAASNKVAEIAFARRTASKFGIHKFVYAGLRAEFGLSAQMAVRAIAKACQAYKRDKNIKPNFRPLGAVQFDQRILSWRGRDAVSILTLDGRIAVPVVYRGRWASMPGSVVRGQVDLVTRDGKWYLVVAVEVPNQPCRAEPGDWLGVDLGVVNLATDSDGTGHCGRGLRAMRRRNRDLRRRLQAKGTKSARRLLKKRRLKESRFARDTNHCISKALVRTAKDTGRGIKLEDLSGIRGRITVAKAQRSDLHSWSFYQLRLFVGYKAAIAGVPVALVDPRNTSRECYECKYVDKGNRRTRATFLCLRCGHAGPADHNAARNIAHRAAVARPHAA